MAQLQKSPIYKVSFPRILLDASIFLILIHILGFLKKSILWKQTIVGIDSLTHIVRLRNIISEGSLYATTMWQMNAPYGMTLHWTMPFDLFVLAPVSLGAIFIGWESALENMAGFAGPLSHFAIILALFWAAKPILKNWGLWAFLFLAVLDTRILEYTIHGRVDHHGFIIASLFLYLGSVLRFLKNGQRQLNGIITGLFGALCLWISIENYPGIVLGIMAIAWAWIFRPKHYEQSLYSLILTFPISIFIALLIDPPSVGLFAIDYYRLSIPTLCFASLISVALFMTMVIASKNKSLLFRAITIALSLLSVGILFLILFPNFLSEKSAFPVYEFFSADLEETQNVFSSPYIFAVSMSKPILGFLSTIILFYQDRKKPWRGGWFLFSLIFIFYFSLGASQLRFGAYANILGSFAFVLVCFRLLKFFLQKHPNQKPKRIRLIMTAVILIVPVIPAGLTALFNPPSQSYSNAAHLGSKTSTSDPSALPRCQVQGIADALNSKNWLKKDSAIIATDIFFGPEIIYRTPHRVLAGPYGSFEAVDDLVNFLYKSPANDAKAIAKERGIDYVLLCPGLNSEEMGPTENSIFSKVKKGEKPDWFKEKSWPENTKTDFALFEL